MGEPALVVTSAMEAAGIHNERDLQRECHLEADIGVNMYLFLLMSSGEDSNLEMITVDPFPRSPARARSGPLCVWKPKREVRELRLRLLSGGKKDSFEALALAWRNRFKQFKAFLHIFYKEAERIRKEGVREGRTLKLVRH